MDRSTFDELVASGSDVELLDAVWEHLPESDGRILYDGDPLRVTQFATSEICNGGFHQFYANGRFDPRKLASYFRLIGAEDLASCVEDSMAVFPGGKPPKRGILNLGPIDGKLEKLGISPDTFEDIDNRFFEMCGDMSELWADRVRANPDVYFAYVRST